MNSDKDQQAHEEIMSLLPWFVNRTLDEQQSVIVTEHVQHCDECQSEIKFLRSMKETVQDDAQADYLEHARVENDLRSVMARIEANEIQSRSPENRGSLFQQLFERIRGYLTAMPIGLQGATAFAAVLVAVLAFQFYSTQSADDYSVLSSAENKDASIRMSLELESSVNELPTDILSLIDSQAQKVVIEEGPDDTYVIVVNDAMTIETLNALVIDLNNQDSIKRVEVLP